MTELQQVAMKMKLADARAELRMSQAALAIFASLSKQVIVNAEKGLAIRRISAHAILHVLNAERQARGMPLLMISDLDWKIDGE